MFSTNGFELIAISLDSIQLRNLQIVSEHVTAFKAVTECTNIQFLYLALSWAPLYYSFFLTITLSFVSDSVDKIFDFGNIFEILRIMPIYSHICNLEAFFA